MDLKKGFRALLGGRLALTVLGAVSLPFIVRVLGPTKYGEYAFLMSAFSMLMLFVSPAVTEGVQKFVAEDRDREYWRERVVGFYLRLAIILAVVVSIAVVAVTASGFVTRLFTRQSDRLLYLLALYVVCAQLGAFTRHALLGLGLEEFSEGFSVLRKVTFLGVGLGLATVGFDVAGLLVGHIVSAVVFSVLGFLTMRRNLVMARVLEFGSGALPTKTLLSFNVFNIVLVVLMQSLFHVDVLMIRYFWGAQQTGYYKAALVLAEYIWLVPIVLQSLMLHSASRLWSDQQYDRIQSLAAKLTRYVFLVTGLLAIGIFVLADRFIPLYYGTAYDAAIQPLVYLLPGAFGFALARPLYGINQATGRLKPLILALGFSAVTNVTLNALLIPRYGIVGAAVATSISYGSMFVLQVAAARYFGYSPLARLRSARLVGTVAIAAPLIYGLDYAIGSDLLALTLVPPAGLLVFTGLALSTGAIDRTELREASSVLPPSVENWVEYVLS